jgi:hypothetical protein
VKRANKTWAFLTNSIISAKMTSGIAHRASFAHFACEWIGYKDSKNSSPIGLGSGKDEVQIVFTVS